MNLWYFGRFLALRFSEASIESGRGEPTRARSRLGDRFPAENRSKKVKSRHFVVFHPCSNFLYTFSLPGTVWTRFRGRKSVILASFVVFWPRRAAKRDEAVEARSRFTVENLKIWTISSFFIRYQTSCTLFRSPEPSGHVSGAQKCDFSKFCGILAAKSSKARRGGRGS